MTPDLLQLLRLRAMCMGAYGETARWPDGGALLDQPVQLIQAFNVIADTERRLKSGE